MSVRTAELVMAIAMAAASIALMYSVGSELPIGWVRGSGPGAGAWPFWLAAGMFVCCVATIIRWFTKATPESTDESPFIDGRSLKIVGLSVLLLVLLLAGFDTISAYISIAIFLFVYVRLLGGHKWLTSILIVVLTPIVLFFFFEWALSIPLPKGYVEELYYPLYDLIY